GGCVVVKIGRDIADAQATFRVKGVAESAFHKQRCSVTLAPSLALGLQRGDIFRGGETQGKNQIAVGLRVIRLDLQCLAEAGYNLVQPVNPEDIYHIKVCVSKIRINLQRAAATGFSLV